MKHCEKRGREDRDGTPSTILENPVGVRHHLFRLGIYVSSDSCGSPRSPSVLISGSAFFRSWPRALWLDASQGHASSQPPRVGRRLLPRDTDFRYRLRLRVLGRTARALRNCGCGAGNHSGFHYVAGNHLPANATTDRPPLSGANRGHLWRRGVGESFVFFG